MMQKARIVLRKELTDYVRDRRSLSSALLMPIFGPALFAVMFSVIASWNREDAPLVVPVAGAKNAPNLVAFLERHGARVETAPPDYEQKIRDGDLDLAISVPDDYGKDFVGGLPAALQLVIDGSRNKSRAPIRRVEQLLSQYSSQLGSLRLLARGVSPSLAAPLAVSEVDLATPEKTAAQLLNVVPIFLLLACFVGGMHLAIDCTAGERERGSLEPLLVNPVSRPAIVAGKWAATVLVAMLALLVTLVAFEVALARVPLQDLGVKVSLELPALGSAGGARRLRRGVRALAGSLRADLQGGADLPFATPRRPHAAGHVPRALAPAGGARAHVRPRPLASHALRRRAARRAGAARLHRRLRGRHRAARSGFLRPRRPPPRK